MTAPAVSIVIRTYNEEKHLPALLEVLRRQRPKKFEILVVDSGSVDHTRDIAARGADKLLRIDRHDFTFGYSLNAGIRAAAAPVVVIISAHTLPVGETWLSTLTAPLAESRTAMVFGRQMGATASKFSEIQDLRRAFDRRRQPLSSSDYIGNNAHSAIRKDLWDQHPFDESLPGLEDIDWAKYWMERGYQVIYEPEAALYHIHEENWRQIGRRYYREAVAAKRIGIKGTRHVLIDPAKELSYLFADLGRVLASPADRPAQKQGLLETCLEIIQFRASKGYGAMKGLLDGAAMQNQTTRETIYFDRPCKAVVIRGPGQASLEEIQIPKINPGEVLIRVAYEGVCATDLEILNGTLGYYKTGLAAYPIVPGHEFSGIIATAGPAVNHVREGDRVVVECIQSCGSCAECRRSNWIGCPDRAEVGVIGRNGGYAEYAVVPGRFVHRLPADFDLKKASLCEPLAVVLKGLNRLSRALPPGAPGRPCAVIGAGSLGHLCARALLSQGHRVTVFDKHSGRRELFAGSGIQTSDHLDDLRNFDVLIEATGDPAALDAVLRLSPAGSTLLLLGLPYDRRDFSFETIVAYDKSIVGSVGSRAEDFEAAIHLLPQLDVSPYLRCVLPLERFKEGLDHAHQKNHLKVLLEVNKDFS